VVDVRVDEDRVVGVADGAAVVLEGAHWVLRLSAWVTGVWRGRALVAYAICDCAEETVATISPSV
jgi:phage shock protein PspC (stress-responsive transcriptional regulator)